MPPAAVSMGQMALCSPGRWLLDTTRHPYCLIETVTKSASTPESQTSRAKKELACGHLASVAEAVDLATPFLRRVRRGPFPCIAGDTSCSNFLPSVAPRSFSSL